MSSSTTPRQQRWPRWLASNRGEQAGFSLIEIAVVLVIVTILLTTLAVPLASQVQARCTDDMRKLLVEANEALRGLSMSNGRFPCPTCADATSTDPFLE